MIRWRNRGMNIVTFIVTDDGRNGIARWASGLVVMAAFVISQIIAQSESPIRMAATVEWESSESRLHSAEPLSSWLKRKSAKWLICRQSTESLFGNPFSWDRSHFLSLSNVSFHSFHSIPSLAIHSFKLQFQDDARASNEKTTSPLTNQQIATKPTQFAH